MGRWGGGGCAKNIIMRASHITSAKRIVSYGGDPGPVYHGCSVTLDALSCHCHLSHILKCSDTKADKKNIVNQRHGC